jgi:hypothetical protein
VSVARGAYFGLMKLILSKGEPTRERIFATCDGMIEHLIFLIDSDKENADWQQNKERIAGDFRTIPKTRTHPHVPHAYKP